MDSRWYLAVPLALGVLLQAADGSAQWGGRILRSNPVQDHLLGGRHGMMQRDAPPLPDDVDPSMAGAFLPMAADLEHMKARGLLPTGLIPAYPEGADCLKVDSPFASRTRFDGSPRSPRYFQGYHGGVDISAPEGTPVLAMAAGEVVHKNEGGGIGGIGLYLRHAPEDTGLPVWTFTEYKHFREMPAVAVGTRVALGAVLGAAGATGTTGGHYGEAGHSHLHFAAFWNTTGEFRAMKAFLPKDGHWLDPLALFRGGELDSAALAALADAEKRVPIAYKTTDGRLVPEGAKVVWPFACAPN